MQIQDSNPAVTNEIKKKNQQTNVFLRFFVFYFLIKVQQSFKIFMFYHFLESTGQKRKGKNIYFGI